MPLMPIYAAYWKTREALISARIPSTGNRQKTKQCFRATVEEVFEAKAVLPGPPKLVGALLIVSITVGYMATDKLIASRFSAKGPALTQDMCGGPTGEVISRRVS
jgi:hypothetical protein